MKVLLIILTLSLAAAARVGGGESYSGGGYSSTSSGSGSGGGDGEAIGILIELLIRLLIYYPEIGIPLLIAGAVFYYISTRKNAGDQAFSQLQQWSASNTVRSQRADLSALRRQDVNFSKPLFFDFVGLLYNRVYLEQRDLRRVGAYLTNSFRQALEGEPLTGLKSVILGGLRATGVMLSAHDQKVVVEVEANLEFEDGHSLFIVDELTFHRRPGALTPPPENVYRLACPNCGSTEPVNASGQCTYCKSQVNDGRFGWLLTGLVRRHTAPKPKLVLSSSGHEMGTDLPTRRSPNLQSALAQVKAQDPSFELEELQEFARMVFILLQEAWTEDAWERARPYETDTLYQQHTFWLQSYRNEGVRNCLEDITVQRVELANIEQDRYFESATFRIFASMKDYKRSLADGSLLAGDPNQVRFFSEYWTFIRRAGVTTPEREKTRCPSCGAPLDRVNQAGICEYCQANITRGDFDWVLSRIEQDEAYFA